VAYTALLSFVAIPIAVGFAILKYRLYDIDLLINHILVYVVYGSLTATLALRISVLWGAEACSRVGTMSGA
jgi:hypothetical protein